MSVRRRLSGVPLLVTSSVCLSLSVACHIIALSTRHWIETSSRDGAEDEPLLNLGLWEACFNNYEHRHELPARRYDGCHSLYSHYYANIRDWLIPPWLTVCRVTAVMALVVQLVCLVLFVVLVVCGVCRFISCPAVQDQLCERVLLYATPITSIVAGVLLMTTSAVFADNGFRLQCRDFSLPAGSAADDNRLSFSWAFEFVSCIVAFVSAGFIAWLVVLKARDDI